MDGSVIVTKSPMDAEVPTLGLYGLNWNNTVSILAEDGVPEALLVYLQGECHNLLITVPLLLTLESRRGLLTFCYLKMRELVSQGRLRRNHLDPTLWTFELPEAK